MKILPKYVYPAPTTGSYRVKIPPYVLDAVTGSKSGTYKDRQDAIDYAAQVHSAYISWKNQDNHQVRVSERSVLGLVLKYQQSNMYSRIKPRTKRSYNHHIKEAMTMRVGGSSRHMFEEVLAANVDYDYAQRLTQDIIEEVSNHKAHHTIKILRVIWYEGMRLNLVRNNPFALVKLPKLQSRKEMWSLDQIDGMIKYCDDNDKASIGTLITLCYHFCQRVGDMRQLTWSNIESMTRGEPFSMYKCSNSVDYTNFVQEKTGAEMSIPLTSGVQKRLMMHKVLGTHEIIVREEGTGKPYTDGRVVKVFRDLANAYGLPKNLWMADLRRTGATYASRAGCTDRELMALTGHTNPQMLIVYARHGNEEAHNAMNKRGL